MARIAAAASAAGRAPDDVKLLPVTKTHPAEAVIFAARYGLPAVGENRVQEAVEKQTQVPMTLRWELVGHLQSNKVRLAVAHFDRIQSVDSEKLLSLLDRAAGELGKKLPVLLQINAGNDPAKFGADPADAPHLLEAALAKPHLQVDGLMTIAPLSNDPQVARRTFANLRLLRAGLAARFGAPLPELSMGMTSDIEAAVAEGSTLVRVGTALYGVRE
ncbi:MAG: YggS family pyridoxal phosphate-dependent enzyme [Opitutaceae bacterium]|nr:YggS family pyridoxal phosphate-dependent enzyme [Opitutaceae bacterium]